MRIAVLGCGNMGLAMITGMLDRIEDISIIAYDKSDDSLTRLPDEVLVVPPDEWEQSENRPDAIIIATKPLDLSDALSPFRDMDTETCNPLFISIAAGKTIASLEKLLPRGARICRVMPNTPALIGEAMSAYCVNSKAIESDKALAQQILSCIGQVAFVPEKLLNAVTGLSGSGPAYVYLFIEALIEGGIAAGLPYAMAKQCAVQTVLGSARMVAQSTDEVSTLKAKVMSPAGTTVKGLMALEEHKFKYSVIKAVVDATARAEEIGKQD